MLESGHLNYQLESKGYFGSNGREIGHVLALTFGTNLLNLTSETNSLGAYPFCLSVICI